MPTQNRKVQPGFKRGTVITEEGVELTPPDNWIFLKAGDGPLTRNVKKRCSTWQVQVQKGKRTLSRGIWADAAQVEAAKKELEEKRTAPDYQRKRAADLQRRQQKHEAYVEEFYQATLAFLSFHSSHEDLAKRLARKVTELATPVGSGTVARTQRISLEQRVEAAVIAWMRHQTTAYDQIAIARIKGRRREVRRSLAKQSKALLSVYRTGEIPLAACPLQKALCSE